MDPTCMMQIWILHGWSRGHNHFTASSFIELGLHKWLHMHFCAGYAFSVHILGIDIKFLPSDKHILFWWIRRSVLSIFILGVIISSSPMITSTSKDEIWISVIGISSTRTINATSSITGSSNTSPWHSNNCISFTCCRLKSLEKQIHWWIGLYHTTVPWRPSLNPCCLKSSASCVKLLVRLTDGDPWMMFIFGQTGLVSSTLSSSSSES